MFGPAAWSLLLSLSLGGCSLLFDAASPLEQVPSDAGGGALDARDGDVSDWEDTSYAHRLAFTVTNPTNEVLSDFPVLLVINSEDLGSAVLSDLPGAQILLDGELVALELDVGEGDRGQRANFWFPVSLDPGETHRYVLYFGSSDRNTGSTTEVWKSYLRVWHLGEDTGPYADSATGLGANAGERTNEGMATAGVVGSGIASGGGAGEPMAKAFEPGALSQSPCVSLSGWIEPGIDTAPSSVVRALVDASGSGEDLGYRLSYAERTLRGPTATFSSLTHDDTVAPIQEQSALPVQAWSWLAVNVEQGTAGPQVQLYVNGAPAGAAQGLISALAVTDGLALDIGSGVNGTVDEVRISTTCRTGAWMGAEYQAMTPPYLPVLEAVEDQPQ